MAGMLRGEDLAAMGRRGAVCSCVGAGKEELQREKFLMTMLRDVMRGRGA